MRAAIPIVALPSAAASTDASSRSRLAADRCTIADASERVLRPEVWTDGLLRCDWSRDGLQVNVFATRLPAGFAMCRLDLLEDFRIKGLVRMLS